ncbi:MAG: winged helix DNA-binding domain-containing protein [Kibdelosporangium sp.]
MTMSLRALNRATLDRQLLLSRSSMQVLDAIEHLVGLQSQTTHSWYHGLWSRLESFSAPELSGLLANRAVVRMVLMRSTIHLVTAKDALALRPLVDIVIERSMSGNFGKNIAGLPRADLIAAGREILDAEPMMFSQLGRRMAERWPSRDPGSLAQAVRAFVPLVQIPPRGLWGRSGQALHSTVETWLGSPVTSSPSVESLVLRYLGAFGPASVRDAQIWSGLTRLAEVFDRLRPRLVTFTDENGRELFDLPDAPRPAQDTPAPPRFLYDFDNLLLSHQDRSRVVTESYRSQKFDADGIMPKILLLDGFTAAHWTVAKTKKEAVLTVHPFRKLLKKEIAGLTEEGADLLRFHAPDSASHDIRVAEQVR